MYGPLTKLEDLTVAASSTDERILFSQPSMVVQYDLTKAGWAGLDRTWHWLSSVWILATTLTHSGIYVPQGKNLFHL